MAPLFPPQYRDWNLPTEVPLSPAAARRVAREASNAAFDVGAQALNEDWHAHLDGKQIQRWGERLGQAVVEARDAEVVAAECGRGPIGPGNPPTLLVLGVDGGRVQMRDADPETGSRWKEDKVVTVTSYLPGDGNERDPEKLVTTAVATMGDTHACGRLARVEADRRGWNDAQDKIVLADCGNWIDPLVEREFGGVIRIADWSHAEEHLHNCGKALHGAGTPEAHAFAEPLVDALWNGRVEAVIAALQTASTRIGAPLKQDGPEHPRRVLAQNEGYFTRNKGHMDYPVYRAKGWPIGSGNTEAGVKQINKRVKGTEQFWRKPGLEPILTLRCLLISQDGRWASYWANRPAYRKHPA